MSFADPAHDETTWGATKTQGEKRLDGVNGVTQLHGFHGNERLFQHRLHGRDVGFRDVGFRVRV